MTSTTTPSRTRRTRVWCIGALVVAALLGGTALAAAGPGEKAVSEFGQTGASPLPVASNANGKTKFKLATFNILGYDHTAPGGTKKGYADGKKRMKWAIQLLKSNEVDVMGLQEFQPEQYDKWIKRASGQYDIWPGYVDTVGFLRNSVAWRKDKFKMVSNTWVKLPYFHGDVLRMPVALLQSYATGQQFYVMNFQNPADVRGNAQKWRLLGQQWQIALVNALRTSNNLPILWVGDMNARDQVFCRVTAEAGMISANGGYRDASTCQPPSNMVVDWIFGSGVKFKKYEQVRGRKVVRTSDHSLVMTKVKILPSAPLFPPAPLPAVGCTTSTIPGSPTATATATMTTTLPPSGAPTATATATTTTTLSSAPSPTTACLTTTPTPMIFPTTP